MMRARLLFAIALSVIVAPAQAETYPARPIKLVVPFAAGAPGDTVGRLLAHAMSKGQTVVVENVSGAGGNIGATYVSRAAPDGYTLLFHQLGMAISPFLYSKLEYDPVKSFEPIGMVAYQANVLVTRPKAMPAKFEEFLSYLKANHDRLAFASTGPGGASDLCAILFKSRTGLDIKTVPYRATAPALTDIIAGNVDLLCDSVATATPFIQAGMVQAYGVTTLTRASSLPDVPTLDELGLKGFDMTTWTAIYAPQGTPTPVIEHLVRSLQDAVQDPKFRESLNKVGSAPWPKQRATPDSLAAMLRQEMDRWGPILKKANIGGN